MPRATAALARAPCPRERRDYRDITGDPLYDPNRHTRVQKLYWHRDGTPLFGVPVGRGGPIVRLSPVDSRGAFMRHEEGGALVVRRDVRELATSQFRFVEGAGGTETIQSVDFPDRYVAVVAGAVRLDPAATAFRRVRGATGVALQLAADPDSYLTHDQGRLAVGPPGGGRTRFLLS
ncbi:hypothetical protein [Phytohabitans houttuyneae]|uniref:Uncharacterized protein n=1 Tax=Phytohabitans houttuyneae TaxID=1076126 RepID=A0A6V8KJB5_9ACTN|nr:hypothetical protein [Phytohabitans houttuyneae]GFJ82531.1 hypothetical protein Phou_067110 [Phytohabitans houttuyneae]